MRFSGPRSTVSTISPCSRSCTRRIWSPPTRRLDGCSHASAVAPPLCGRIRSAWHVPSSTTCRTAEGRGPMLSTRQTTSRVRRPTSPEATYGEWACARVVRRPAPVPAVVRGALVPAVPPCPRPADIAKSDRPPRGPPPPSRGQSGPAAPHRPLPCRCREGRLLRPRPPRGRCCRPVVLVPTCPQLPCMASQLRAPMAVPVRRRAATHEPAHAQARPAHAPPHGCQKENPP